MEDFAPAIYNKEYKELIQFYFLVKELVTAAERYDPKQRLSIVAIAELRSALDHLMRTHGLISGVIDKDEVKKELGLTPDEYCSKNLNKAYGHLFRSGYDAYDIIGLRLLDDVNHILKKTSIQALYAVIPDAATTVTAPHRKGEKLFSQAKSKKDVCSREAEEKQFRLYEEASNQLEDVRSLLEAKSKDLVAFDREQKTNVKKALVISIILLVIGFLLPTSWKDRLYSVFKEAPTGVAKASSEAVPDDDAQLTSKTPAIEDIAPSNEVPVVKAGSTTAMAESADS